MQRLEIVSTEDLTRKVRIKCGEIIQIEIDHTFSEISLKNIKMMKLENLNFLKMRVMNITK